MYIAEFISIVLIEKKRIS